MQFLTCSFLAVHQSAGSVKTELTSEERKLRKWPASLQFARYTELTPDEQAAGPLDAAEIRNGQPPR